MDLSQSFKHLPQKFVKYQKRTSIGSNSLKKKYIYNRKIMSIAVMKDRKRLFDKPIITFIRKTSAIKSSNVKFFIKKILNTKVRVKRKKKKIYPKHKNLLFFTGTYAGIFTRKPSGLRMGKGKGSLIETSISGHKCQTILKISSKLNFISIRKKITNASKKLSPNSVQLFFL